MYFKIAKYFKLNKIEKNLFFLCILYSGIYRFQLLVFPMKVFFRYSGIESGSSNDFKDVFHILTKTMNRIVKIVPWNCNCLVRALTYKKILTLYGIPSILILRLIKNERLFAHAYIRPINYQNLLDKKFAEFAFQ